MPKPTPSTDTGGFTLVELLIAMAILLIVLGIVIGSLTEALSQQRDTESTVSIEASLRRTSQIITQDLRNSAYGLLTSSPYVSGNTSISIARITDTAVHSVTGPTTGFQASTSVQVITATSFNWPVGTRFLLINPTTAQRTATVHTLSTNVTTGGVINLLHVPATNTVCYSPDNLVQRVDLVGYSLNASQQILYRNSQGTAVPLAYGVSDFRVTYIDTAGTTYTRLQDMPASATLARVGLRLDMQRTINGRVKTRTSAASVEIPKVFTLTNSPLRYVAPNASVTC